MTQNTNNLICMAVITSAHGIDGGVKLKSFASSPEALFSFKQFYDAKGEENFTLRKKSISPNAIIAYIAGVKDRNTAERLVGTKLFIMQEKLPAAAEDEFYHTDLVGLKVLDERQQECGKVVGVHNFGAGDLLEILFIDTKSSEYISFTQEMVPQIEVASGYIVVNKPLIDQVIAKD